MTESKDALLHCVTVRLRDIDSGSTIGTGVVYSERTLNDQAYIITAAHTLYSDSDTFKQPRVKITLEFFNPISGAYEGIQHTIDFGLVSADVEKDLAVLIVNRKRIEKITGPIPVIYILNARATGTDFIVKGFPRATQGEELASIAPTWVQPMAGTRRFQLRLHEDYSSWATNGFSGSGIFLSSGDELYLLGVFTRYGSEEKGKVIYCQFAEDVNAVLTKSFKTSITVSFFGSHGLTPMFFKHHITSAINNLGPRYNPVLNVNLPIAKLFSDIARDSTYRNRLTNIIDHWLLSRSYRYSDAHTEIRDIEETVSGLKKSALEWINALNWSAEHAIELKGITEPLDKLGHAIETKRFALHRLQEEKEKGIDPKVKQSYSYQAPLHAEIDRLLEIARENHEFNQSLDTINTYLSNHPTLLIQGDPGCGKSHLLGDIAHERIEHGTPALLLLGHLFKPGLSVWENVRSQLELNCTKEELFSTLNLIGQQTGARVLLMIDALNEGAGKDIWPGELAGFIATVRRYPYIALVLTVRSTYYKAVIPEAVESNIEVVKVTHEGFKGNEYKALKLFCTHYGLEQPNFPILAPEFANPLFLQLVCQGIQKSGRKVCPLGLHGLSAILELYINAIVSKLEERREEYRLRKYIINQSIQEIAKAIFANDHWGVMRVPDAVSLMDNKFPTLRFLLDDLIRENVFMLTMRWDSSTSREEEFVGFAYERLGDFLIAQDLIGPFKTAEEIKNAAGKDGTFGKLIDGFFDKNGGVLHVLAIILPERYKLEIFEVFEWVFKEIKPDEGMNTRMSYTAVRLNETFLDSLKWRDVPSLDNTKLTTWMRSEHFRVHRNHVLTTLVELTTVSQNPFNSDRLFAYLIRFSLAERDSFWLEYLRYFSSHSNEDGTATFRRLIDWAWQPGISAQLNSESARLAGQTIAWAFASTKIALRDEATKAMVNLLEEQPDSLLAILKAFEPCNDPYITERLYAVAYGCALRTTQAETVKKIAQYAFDTVFKKSPVNPHILIRDYARSTIELAVHLKVTLHRNLKKIKPPYGQALPVFPTPEETDALELSHEAPDFKETYGFNHNQILHSVLEWDFGRYIIDPVTTRFTPVSFTFEEKLRKFKRKLTSYEKKWLKYHAEYIQLNHELEVKADRYERLSTEDLEKYKKDIQEALHRINDILKQKLSKKKYAFVAEKIVPHLLALSDSKNWQRNNFAAAPVKRWIVKRVFELGYDAKLHGPYESSLGNYRQEHKIERIGKKYQWIAFHEAIGLLADNYYRKVDRWSNDSKLVLYEAEFEEFIRNVDPAFTTRNPPETDEDIPAHRVTNPDNWWHIPDYNFWNIPDEEWIGMSDDLPDIKRIISSTDTTGHEWLCLSGYAKWRRPKPIGEDTYGKTKEIWYMIQGYLVRKQAKAKIIDHLRTQNFFNRWMPESHKASSSLFNRENYWAPAANVYEREIWQAIRNTNLKIMPTTSEAVGEMSGDKSGAHFRYEMPCKLILEGMNLRYAANDGDFISETGEVVAINPSERGVMVRRDHLENFLKENKLDIVWTLLGEKLSFHSRGSEQNFFKVVNGVYSFHHGELQGTITLADRT